ncbi:MAG: prolyl oligopeptidase family serine peptidase, partial [Acidobacteriota bacterium]|nr:prolyl oligopeptidase family serine peptidase [Acidobacteriota bacterium]
PTEKLPLLVVIHGGPTGTSRPTPVSAFVYPVVQWMARGALVLMPNYRDSAGYGADFRALNVRNLGVGDAWDVETGVEALIDRGWVDPERVGAMGWSQGGYISSFLATASELFAGNSDWMTNYVNTDIHRFTRNYLEATPWDDPDVYAKTSPMTYIQGAKTPTLIQHANADRRVPVPNAYQLYQGLRDVGVEAELIIFPELGLGIAEPKARLAANWQNWRWFEKHIWGHEIDLPLPEPDEEDE